jgi:hypothetical protein
MKEALRSSGTSVLTRATRHNIPENTIPHTLKMHVKCLCMSYSPYSQSSEEVTYAELCLAKPTALQDPTFSGGNYKVGSGVVIGPSGSATGIVRGREEPTIYAQIDHTRRPQPPSPLPQGCNTTQLTALSPLVSPISCAPLTHPAMLHREIVTVRTPLMANQQESCV